MEESLFKTFLNFIFRWNIDIFLIFLIFNLYVLINLNLVYGLNLYLKDSILLIFSNIMILMHTYLINKVSDSKEDAINNNPVMINIIYLAAFTILTIFLSFLMYLNLYKDIIFFWFFLITVSFLYSFPRKFRLKQFFIIKNATPSFSWYLSICLLIYINTHGLKIVHILFDHYPLFIFIFIFSILWDMPDLKGDRLSGVKTFPVIIGFGRTKILLSCLSIIVFLLSRTFAAALISIIMLLGLYFSREDRHKNYYHILVLLVVIAYVFSSLKIFAYHFF